jgi:hypothetical protein
MGRKKRRASVWRWRRRFGCAASLNSFRPLRLPLARRQHPTEADDVIVMGSQARN